MAYAGNPALSPEVRERILNTFHQTLDLAAGGSHQEATLGCDFILQLDPEFQPARQLQERLKSRSGAEPVAVDDLRGGADPAGAAAGPGGAHGPADDELLDDLDLSDELGEELLEELPPAAAAPAAPGSGGDLQSLRRDLQRLSAERRYEAVVALAEGRRDEVAADPELTRLAAAAAARQEAAPYVASFLTQAAEARRAGRPEEAAALLDKARTLDPDHPGLEAAEGAAPGGAAAGGSAAGGSEAGGSAADELRFDLEPQLAAATAATPGSGTVSDSERRIAELLDEGQAALERGDPQSAIDAWSRIFLIDIDHKEASRRIDEARRLKSENERQVEEVFHEAVAAEETGDREAARRGYESVLALTPGHLAARDRLEALSGGGAAPAAGAPPASPGASPPPAGDPLSGRSTPPATDELLREEILVPPEPGQQPAEPTSTVARPSLVAVRESRAGSKFLLIGSLVLVVVAAAAWLVYQKRGSIFPNSETAAPTAVVEDPIARATRLHDAGRTAIAINQLRRLPPSSPQYEEAQALISQWEAADQPAETPPSGPSEEELARRRTLISAAAEAAGRGENLVARTRLQRAGEILPLDGEAAAFSAQVEERLQPIASMVALYEEGEYEQALPALWRAYQKTPDDPDLRRLIVDANYNMGVHELQRGDAQAAVPRLKDAAELDPDDPEIARSLSFARTYAQRDKDLLYRIYVKYLPPR